MKKNIKVFSLTVLIIIFALVTIMYYKNKNINNQPKKSKLVNSLKVEDIYL